MRDQPCLLLQVVRQPIYSLELGCGQLEQLLNQARASNTLAMLAHLLAQHHVLERLPSWFVRHMLSAIQAAAAVHRSVRWEIFNISRALRNIDTPVVILKGAAYVLLDNTAAAGRIFSDVDFLVPRQRIREVEKTLLGNGWVRAAMSRYDDRYYRQWMHEVPPLKHIKRKSTLDVHHAILPLTTKVSPNTDLLIRDAVLVNCQFVEDEVYVLSPLDMLLHSATHLFYDGELEHGFRDMIDLMRLLDQYCQDEANGAQLLERARELQLERPIFYALRYCTQMFNYELPVPLAKYAGDAPSSIMSRFHLVIMDWLFLRALRPKQQNCDLFASGLARWLLYVRSHYLRMPLYLLLPHLMRKAIMPKQAPLN